MQGNRLKIHTSLRPDLDTNEAETKEPKDRFMRTRLRVSQKILLTTGERLIRNTAIAGAVFLCVLAIRNVNQPWTSAAMSGLKQAMTMRMDWDESIGRLSFVRSLMPDASLVFHNMNGKSALLQPAHGTISHAYSSDQPWIEYAVEAETPVLAVADGVVTAAAQGIGGDWIVLLAMDGGDEAVYGYLAAVQVQTGQSVAAGDVIGMAANSEDARVYFELREDNAPADPGKRMR